MRLPAGIGRMVRRWRRDESGAAFFEMAIALPFLLLAAIGVAEFGRVYFNAIRVANAAMAGAEYGAQNLGTGDPAGIRQVARNDAGDQTLQVTSTRACRCPGSEAVVDCLTVCAGGYGSPQYFIEVAATKTHTFLLRYPGLPQSITVTRTSTFREQ
jgi:Flp pilus assembly protein TadG